MQPLTIFGRDIIDSKSIDQIKRCLVGESVGVLTADAHYGYGHPIGGAVAYRDKISLSGVGFDIACGNKAVMTEALASDVDIPAVMDEIMRRIGFGVGRPNPEPVDHPVFEKIARAPFKPQRELLSYAQEQLGTVGSGNHFIDLLEDEHGRLWIGVHFGSRGFGFKTTMGFIAMSKGRSFHDHVAEGGMDAPPILFDAHSQIGQEYIEAVALAGEYAYAGRDLVVDKVLGIVGTSSVFTVHNHHNFLWKERHFGEDWWVVRKGCTPAFPGQLGFIGANMGDTSVIVEGVEGALSEKGLYSTVHGAGRVMSRTAAAGKRKWKNGRMMAVSRGVVDFDQVRNDLKQKHIELRGGGADEAPACYKPLEQVLRYHKETIRIIHRLRPVGVAMAGEDIFDPYKD